jgi:hypothetical protein
MFLPYRFRTNKVVSLLEPHEPSVHKSTKKPMFLILSPFINNTSNYLVGSLLSISVESGPIFGVSLHIVYPGHKEKFVSEKSLILVLQLLSAATAYITYALRMKINITHQRTLLERPYQGYQQHCEKEEKYEIPFYVRNREHGRNLVRPGGKKIIQRPPTAMAMNLSCDWITVQCSPSQDALLNISMNHLRESKHERTVSNMGDLVSHESDSGHLTPGSYSRSLLCRSSSNTSLLATSSSNLLRHSHALLEVVGDLFVFRVVCHLELVVIGIQIDLMMGCCFPLVLGVWTRQMSS